MTKKQIKEEKQYADRAYENRAELERAAVEILVTEAGIGPESEKTMTYKGYTGVVTFNEAADLFHGEVIDTRDVITFQGRSVKELRKAFRDSVDDYLTFCADRGEEPEKPLFPALKD